jgi:AraC family transcriptional regulator
MGQPPEEMLKVGSEVRVSAATAQLVHFHFTDPIDIVMMDREAYWLDMCLQPRPNNARACYLDHWAAQRFERIGRVYLLPPGETIQTRSDGANSHSSVLCHLHPEALNRWFDGELKWTGRRLEATLDIPDANIRRGLLKLADEMRHPGFASQVLVELIAAQLAIELGRYFAHFDEIPPAGGLAQWRLRAVDERLADLQELPTLDELAALCNLSVRQLTRGFRASRDCSIGDYIANHRIQRAKRLLVSAESIKSVAYSLGFNSSSGFCFAFRRATGLTPGEFRAAASSLIQPPGATQPATARP